MKSFVFIISIVLSSFASAKAELEPCGKVIFNKDMTCTNPDVKFDVTECDPGVKKIHPAAKSVCEGEELVSTIKLNNMNYRAVFVKGYNGTWSQRGQVWRVGKEAKETKAKSEDKKEEAKVKAEAKAEPKAEVKAEVKTDAASAEKPKTSSKKKKKTEAKAEASAEKSEVKVVPKAESKTESKPESKPEAKAETQPEAKPAEAKPEAATADEPWKFKFGGWAFIEYESLKNIGDGITSPYDSNDAFSQQHDTNLLSNLQFTATKDRLTFDSILEVGEVFFGDPPAASGGGDTGGSQGLRAKIIELRNFNLQEEFSKNWFFKAGLWSVNADPRGFILSDHHAGAQVRHEDEITSTQLWYADATDSKPGKTVTGDSYVGLSHNQKYGENNYTAFAVHRSTRESFVDKDLVTNVTGESKYTWLGVNNVMKNTLGLTNFEQSVIVDQSNFKGDHGGPTDSNNGWLAHVRADKDLEDGWNLALDALGTSGVDDSRANGTQVLGQRKNFASPDPSEAYLLTVVTSDGADEAPGSARTTNNPGRLDLDEGLRMAVFTVSKNFGEKVETFVRYGQVMTAVAKLGTDSKDYGHEIDLHVKYKSTKNTSWILDYGLFTPGKYFTQRDEASLTSLRYRLEF